MGGKMLDSRPLNTHYNEPTNIVGRFTGAGTSAPTAVANVIDSGSLVSVLTRSGVGTLSFVLQEPIGVIQNYDFWIASAANNKNVSVTPPGTGFTFALQVSWQANGVAVDVAANEELLFEINKSNSGRP